MSIRVSEDVVPIGEFKAQASRWLEHAKDTGQPVLITQNGRPAAVLLSPVEYDRLRERQRLLESIAAALEDVEAGRTMTTSEVKRHLAARRRRKPNG
jgi:prevent-host-death family protein